MTDALVRRLEAESVRLSQRAIGEMYEDPFWLERFGERGRRFAEQDSQYHVSYLVSALAVSNPGILTGYARWLQSLLVSRGMCTRHVAENFERLEHAIEAEIPDAGPALALLRAAREALRYQGGVARELQDRAEALVETTVAAVYRRKPDWSAHEPRRFHEDVLHVVSYLADALALARPELFVTHVAWLAGFLVRRSFPAEQLPAALEQLVRALAEDAGVSEDLRAAAHDMVGKALERLLERAMSPAPAARVPR